MASNPPKLENPKKNAEAKKAAEEKKLSEARATAERYKVPFTTLDTVSDINAKIAEAKKNGVVPENPTPEEQAALDAKAAKGTKLGAKPAPAPVEPEDKEITSPEELELIQKAGKLQGWSGWKTRDKEGNVDLEAPSRNEKGEYVWVKGAVGIVRVLPMILLALVCLFGGAAQAAVDPSDEGVEGNNRWRVTSSGHFLPAADSTYNIGASGTEVLAIYADSATIGTTTVTSATITTITGANGETIANSTDDSYIVTSNDEHMTWMVKGFEAKDAILALYADEGDDAADKASIKMSAAGALTFEVNAVAFATFTTSTGALALTGDLTGDAGDQLYGFLQDQVATTTTSVTAAQAGKTFVSDSADVMTLPEASTVLGARYTFVCGTADDLDINPADGTDQIGIVTSDGAAITPSAGDAIRITDTGASVTLEAVGANLWAVIAFNGAVTDVN